MSKAHLSPSPRSPPFFPPPPPTAGLRCREPDGRRRGDVRQQDDRRERRQLEGSPPRWSPRSRRCRPGSTRCRARGRSPCSRRPTPPSPSCPPALVETLLKPENKPMLVKILTCHVVAADAMSPAIAKMIADDKGTHPVKTGRRLRAAGEDVRQKEHRADRRERRHRVVTIADVKRSRTALIHVIDAVLLPKNVAPPRAVRFTLRNSSPPIGEGRSERGAGGCVRSAPRCDARPCRRAARRRWSRGRSARR